MLSAVASFLLSPFNCLIVLLLAAWLIRRRGLKKILIITAAIVFVVFGNRFFLNAFARYWQPAPVEVSRMPVYDCGIVAGGFASPDAQAQGYFNASSDRFIQTVKLYKLGRIRHILISGGNGKDSEESYREAAFVREELRAFGVPDSVIITEDHSHNTRENAIHSRHLLDSLQFKPPFLLITSAYHIPRAALLFTGAGVPVDAFPCNYTDGRGGFSVGDLLPRPSVLMGWETYLKEVAGYVVSRL